MEQQKEIRKNQNLLVSSAKAIRIFAFWSFLRSMIYLIVSQDKILELMGDRAAERDFVVVSEVLLVAIFLSISLVYLFVAYCAVDEGKKTKRHWTLFFWAVFLLLFSFYEIYTDLQFNNEFSLAENIAVFATDIVSALFIVQIIRSAAFLRRYANAG